MDKEIQIDYEELAVGIIKDAKNNISKKKYGVIKHQGEPEEIVDWKDDLVWLMEDNEMLEDGIGISFKDCCDIWGIKNHKKIRTKILKEIGMI